MREAASLTAAPAATRRRAVGDRYPGVYERVSAKGDRTLEIDYYDEVGRRRWRSLPAGTTLAAALAAREKLRVRRREGERFVPAKSPMIVEVWERWLADASVSLRPRTVDAYRQGFARIVPRLGRVRVGQLDRPDVLRLIRALQRDGLAAWTVRGTLTALSLFCDWAEDEGLRSGNPVKSLRRKDRPRVARMEHRQLRAADLWGARRGCRGRASGAGCPARLRRPAGVGGARPVVVGRGSRRAGTPGSLSARTANADKGGAEDGEGEA